MYVSVCRLEQSDAFVFPRLLAGRGDGCCDLRIAKLSNEAKRIYSSNFAKTSPCRLPSSPPKPRNRFIKSSESRWDGRKVARTSGTNNRSVGLTMGSVVWSDESRLVRQSPIPSWPHPSWPMHVLCVENASKSKVHGPYAFDFTYGGPSKKFIGPPWDHPFCSTQL